MRGITTMSLDAWLFGEDAQATERAQQLEQMQTSPPLPRPSPLRPGSNKKKHTTSASRRGDGSTSVVASATTVAPTQSIGRSNSLPVNSLSHRVAARAKKASLALALSPTKTPSTTTTDSSSDRRATLADPPATTNHTPPPPQQQQQQHSELFPVSSKLRKLFRPNRLQWNRSRQSLATTPEEKQRQLLGLSTESFQRLQGHVPFTLKEIVKDPKKLPYLLRWLSTDDEETPSSTVRTNYHQVLLFLLEIEQLQLVADEKRHEQALKIWHKYIDHASEFQIATTLELTHELEALVRENIDGSSDKVLDSFFPIQKLAYMRLTREEMPRFLKSAEYLQMLIDTENDTESVPMERILQQPRAAHYFLLFLMQSRQHFELYFWLHVEYVLKPLLESESYDLFWKLARMLLKKAQNDSQAITLGTKNDLHAAIDAKKMDAKLHPPQPVARALFMRAQQEIFVMLRSSWFNRFMKSNLYKVALKDCQIHLNQNESKADSPPKLLTRMFSSLEYSSSRRLDTSDADADGDADGDEESSTELDAMDKNDEIRDESAHKSLETELAISVAAFETSSELPSGSEDGSEADSDVSSETGADEAIDFTKMELNLESIIRLTKLPDGLQVHYRPHYDAPTATASLQDTHDQQQQHPQQLQHHTIDTILTFATAVEKKGKGDPKATMTLSEIRATDAAATDPRPVSCHSTPFEDISRRVKAFLVPDGRVMIKSSDCSGGGPPGDSIFPFQQSGRDGFLYGFVFLTYEPVRVGRKHQRLVYASRGICVLSRFPLVRTLRRVLESHVVESLSREQLFDVARLTLLFPSSAQVPSMEFVSQIPLELMRRRTRSESGAAQSALRKALVDTRVDVSVKPLFDHFGSAIALQIIACALLECSVVFVASQYSLLTACAEAVRCLLRPFAWCHVYAPVLPKPLLSYLQCPTPILVGLHSGYADRSDLPTAGFYAVADLDRRVLEFVDARHSVSWRRLGLQFDGNTPTDSRLLLPRAFETAKRRLDSILTRPSADEVDCVQSRGVASGLEEETEDAALLRGFQNDEERIRVVCFELLSGLLDGLTDACLVVGDTKESVVIFDETQFLASRTAAEDAGFYEALFRSQCFSEIVSAHRIDVTASDDGAEHR